MSTLTETITTILRTFNNFTRRGGGIQMWPYQLEPADAVLNSVTKDLGLTIILIISRQAGKDETLANLVAYILRLFSHIEAKIVFINPTYKPQTENSLIRLESRLDANLLTREWKKRGAYIRKLGKAMISFLSGDKKAKIVSATANKLLIVNEAQDITPAKFDKDISPMGAYSNVTRLIVGTVWTSQTLLSREEDAAREQEKRDGIKRVFVYNCTDVRKHNENYGAYVDKEVAKLGREHPLVKSQYFCERIDSQAGMFNAGRRALMLGDQPAHETPQPDHIYSFLIDVAGQDEANMSLDEVIEKNPGRDQLTLTIVSVDLSSLELLQAPTYRAVKRLAWTGANHITVFAQLQALASSWSPLYFVIDATGVGEGLWAMLDHAFPTKVIPVKFSQSVKSEIGYSFLAIINTGRFRDCCPAPEVDKQYAACTSEILIGPAKTMRWSVPDGTRDSNGLLIHDDYVLADSLTSQLDKLEWLISSPTLMTTYRAPLDKMRGKY